MGKREVGGDGARAQSGQCDGLFGGTTADDQVLTDEHAIRRAIGVDGTVDVDGECTDAGCTCQRHGPRQRHSPGLTDLLLQQRGRVAYARVHVRAIGHLLPEARHVHRGTDNDAGHDEENRH